MYSPVTRTWTVFLRFQTEPVLWACTCEADVLFLRYVILGVNDDLEVVIPPALLVTARDPYGKFTGNLDPVPSRFGNGGFWPFYFVMSHYTRKRKANVLTALASATLLELVSLWNKREPWVTEENLLEAGAAQYGPFGHWVPVPTEPTGPPARVPGEYTDKELDVIERLTRSYRLENVGGKAADDVVMAPASEEELKASTVPSDKMGHMVDDPPEEDKAKGKTPASPPPDAGTTDATSSGKGGGPQTTTTSKASAAPPPDVVQPRPSRAPQLVIDGGDHGGSAKGDGKSRCDRTSNTSHLTGKGQYDEDHAWWMKYEHRGVKYSIPITHTTWCKEGYRCTHRGTPKGCLFAHYDHEMETAHQLRKEYVTKRLRDQEWDPVGYNRAVTYDRTGTQLTGHNTDAPWGTWKARREGKGPSLQPEPKDVPSPQPEPKDEEMTPQRRSLELLGEPAAAAGPRRRWNFGNEGNQAEKEESASASTSQPALEPIAPAAHEIVPEEIQEPEQAQQPPAEAVLEPVPEPEQAEQPPAEAVLEPVPVPEQAEQTPAEAVLEPVPDALPHEPEHYMMSTPPGSVSPEEVVAPPQNYEPMD
jgi:hypothetical protein